MGREGSARCWSSQARRVGGSGAAARIRDRRPRVPAARLDARTGHTPKHPFFRIEAPLGLPAPPHPDCRKISFKFSFPQMCMKEFNCIE